MSPTVDFFYDISSPYTYLAAHRVDAAIRDAGGEVRWRPMLLGAVFKGTGNTMPANVPAKAKWMLGDLHKWAKRIDRPFSFPSSFPANTVKAQRACIAAEELFGKGRDFALALFRAYWEQDRDPASDEAIQGAAKDVDLDGDALIAKTSDQAIKDALRTNTEEALSLGVFGAPSFVLEGELYWGNDRLDWVADAVRAKTKSG